MNKLERVYLKDIADTQTGPFGTQLHEKDYVNVGTPIVTVEHLGEIGFNKQNLPLVSEADKLRLSKYILKEGDIVFSRVGSVDRCTYVSNKEDGWMFSGRCLRVRFNEKANAKYVSYYFRQKFFKEMMLNISVGATMPSLNTSLMANIPLYLPKKEIQQKIASVLSSLDSKIELNNRINAELEAMAKTLYDYWFVQFEFPVVTSSGVEKPYKTSGGKMVWNEELKREIPTGFGTGSLLSLGEIIGGSTPPREVQEYFSQNGTAWITPKDLSMNGNNKFISKGELDVSDKGIKAASLNVMPKGTIMLSTRAPIGYLAISRKDVTTNQGFKSFVPNKGFSTEYVYYSIKNMIPTIENNAVGSTFKEISATTLKSIPVILPEKETIENYTSKVRPIFERQNLLEQENQKLSELRDWLLPMLMNGQVKVGEVDDKVELGMAAEPRGTYNKSNVK